MTAKPTPILDSVRKGQERVSIHLPTHKYPLRALLPAAGTLVGAFSLGIANKFLEPYAGAVVAKIAILVLIILFIQKRPRGLFALKGRAVEA